VGIIRIKCRGKMGGTEMKSWQAVKGKEWGKARSEGLPLTICLLMNPVLLKKIAMASRFGIVKGVGMIGSKKMAAELKAVILRRKILI